MTSLPSGTAIPHGPSHGSSYAPDVLVAPCSPPPEEQPARRGLPQPAAVPDPQRDGRCRLQRHCRGEQPVHRGWMLVPHWLRGEPQRRVCLVVRAAPCCPLPAARGGLVAACCTVCCRWRLPCPKPRFPAILAHLSAASRRPRLAGTPPRASAPRTWAACSPRWTLSTLVARRPSPASSNAARPWTRQYTELIPLALPTPARLLAS